MQLFRTEERQRPEFAARFDSETVREVLARASEIDANKETESLTAAQVEALGREIGLSPDAIRRALNEKIGTADAVVGHSPIYRTGTTLTQEQVRAAFLPNVWLVIVTLLVVFATGYMATIGALTIQLGLILSLLVAIFTPIFLSCRAGFIVRSFRYAILGGALTAFLCAMSGFLATTFAGANPPGTDADKAILLLTFGGALFGGVGATARRCWDRLPRQVER